ncbi:hypothetical protein [Pseudonocardia sp. HH130630-07]|uniref:hypothetical protein n=1 Tax=Pseudonocardia sp. HH130630-07 TaxID=1690815 RepID=UPI000814E155|nr:hypothetical protein [Pseudonocardia sp. HH130630-07]ANY10630.1 hypothetical protein AFB00_29940 [Pseudonocardia sp. HH130630-07]
MEIVLFSLLMAWGLTRYGVTDLVATARGTESPRIAERRQRSAQAHERAMARGGQTVGSAIGSRIADRIANPHPRKDKQRGPARNYFAGLWADSWDRAAEKHRERTEQRRGGQDADATTTETGTKDPATEPTGPDTHEQKVRIVDHEPTDGTADSDTDSDIGERTAPGASTTPGTGDESPAPASTPDGHAEAPAAGSAATGGAPGPGAMGSVPPGTGLASPIGPEPLHVFHHFPTAPTTPQAGTSTQVVDDPDDEIIDAEIVEDPPTQDHAAAAAQEPPVQRVYEERHVHHHHYPPATTEPAAAAGEPGPGPDDGVTDAEIVDDPAQGTGAGERTPQTTPAGTGRGDTTATEAPTMTHATSTTEMASGETLDPTAAKNFSASMQTVAENAVQQIELSISNLEQRGVSGEPIDLLRQMQESFTTAVTTAENVAEHFDRHIGHQDQLLSDDTIAGTVRDTYVGSAS